MKIEIKELIKQETSIINNYFKKAAEINNLKVVEFKMEDYYYLQESIDFFGLFSVPFFLSYSIAKDFEYRSENTYIKSIWYWKEDIDKTKSKNFLPNQIKLMRDTLKSYLSLVKDGHYLQALIIFRSYLEYSSQLYASIIDYEFFQKYTTTNLSTKEMMSLWFQSLKPTKVQDRIKKLHQEINSSLSTKNVQYPKKTLYRRKFHPFDSNLRNELYKELSGLAHGKHTAIVEYNEIKLYSLIWLCTSYLVESATVIDELTSIYFKISPKELFTKWITVEIYSNVKQSKTIYLDYSDS